LLIQAEHNRKVQHELDYLIPTIDQAPVLGQQTIELERNPERPARRATLTVRAMPVRIEVPRHHQQPQQCVVWYSFRWLIERFHFTRNSGCRIEQLQLETAERLLKALATYSIVAWRLMWLTDSARLSPGYSCETV
jgi:hypothetical protein